MAARVAAALLIGVSLSIDDLSAQQTMSPPTSASTSPAATVSVSDPDGKPMPAGRGVIEGRVVEGASEAPVSGATVTLALPGSQPVVLRSDAGGGFRFNNLPAGRYSLTVRLDGYLGGAFGRQRPLGPIQALDLVEREQRMNVTLRVWRDGAMTGQVVDAANQPIPGAVVRALSRSVVAGARQWTFGPSARTDERGMYRVSNLVPGDYLIALPLSSAPGAGAARATYDTMFYVAATSASRALVVPVGSGEERAGLDFVVQPTVSVVRVSGSLAGADGEPAAGLRVTLTAADAVDLASPLETAATTTDAQGGFTFARVTPGEYVVRALSFATTAAGGASTRPSDAALPLAERPVWWAEVPVSVTDKDVRDLTATLRTGLHVSGTIQFEGGAAPADRPITDLEVFLTPADGRVAQLPSRGPIAATGRFTTAGLLPGKYTVRIAGQIPGWTPKTAMLNGRDVSDEPLDLETTDVDGVVITFTNHPTELTGHVVAARGIPDPRAAVVVFPADSSKWSGPDATLRRFYRLRVTPAAEFTARNLPPGSYLVAAIPDSAAPDWMDPAFLESISRLARRVQVADGARPAPQELRTLTVR